MNKIIFKGIIIALGVAILAGCCRTTAKAEEDTPPLQASSNTPICEQDGSHYSYKEVFEFDEGGGFFSDSESVLLTYIPESPSGFISLKTRGKGKVKSLLIRSKEAGKYVKVEKPVVIATSTGASSTSFYLKEGELLSLLQILQRPDASIKINSYSNYRIIRHRRSARNKNILFASSFEKMVELSRKISRG